MAYGPIAHTIPQYEDFPNWFLKAFQQSTTTPVTNGMAIDSDGNGSASKFELNSEGFPKSSGGALVIPFIDVAYDLWLFPTAAEADANDTSNAKLFGDNLTATPPFSGAVKTFDTLADAVADTGLVDGDTISLKERTTGNGGGAVWDVVLTSTVIPNTFDIVISTGNALLSLKLPIGAVLNCDKVGAIFDGTTGVFDAIDAALNTAASIVTMPTGHGVLDGDLVIPHFKSLEGVGLNTSSGTDGTTLLYPGTGEAIRQVGTQNTVPFIKGQLDNFRIRKTVQASTKAGIALISGNGVSVNDLSLDSDSAGYNFKYGIVCDQTEVATLRRVRVEGASNAGILLTNGAEYTAGNSSNFTNVISIYDVNINGCGVYGIAHNGGATFKLSGGNINQNPVGVYIGGLNNFIIEGLLFESGTGQADIYISQFKDDLSTSVGGCNGGRISECRLSSATTNCIYVNGPGSQSSHISIFDNRFGSARSGSAIGLSDSDALQNCEIGININLGTASKNYLDAGVYTWNSITGIAANDQLEQKRMILMPGISSTANGGVEKAVKFTSAVAYTVDDLDDSIHCDTASNIVTVNLQTATTGRTITVLRKVGANNVVVDAGVGKKVFVNGTGSQTRTLSAVGNAITIQAESDGGDWYTISETTI